MSVTRESPDFLTVPEAAELLRVPLSWIYARSRLGAIPCRKIGGKIIIPRQELLNWVDGQQPAQAAAT